MSPPQLPAFAIPKPKQAAPAKPQAVTTPSGFVATEPKREPVKSEPPRVEQPKPANLPSNGQELHRRLREYDAKLASQKLCPVGALLAHVTQAGVKAGFTANMSEWTGPAIQFAVDAVKEFDQSARQGKSEPRTAA